MNQQLRLEILTDKNRLQEIYDLRVVAYEASIHQKHINKTLYPNGWFDHFDPQDNTIHFVVLDNNTIVAAARLIILDGEITLSGYTDFDLPNERPFAYWSRMVVHPDYVKLGLGDLLHNVRLKYITDHPAIKFAILSTYEYSRTTFDSMGFRYLGPLDFKVDQSSIPTFAYIFENTKKQ